MSRILDIRFIVVVIILILEVIILVVIDEALFIVLLVNVLGILFYILNRFIRNKAQKQFEDFGIRGRRNLNKLIICDLIDIKTDDTCMQIKIPNCSLKDCYEILRHTSSILDENTSYVELYIKKDNINKNRLSIFDYYIFHRVTFDRYNISNYLIKEAFPLLFDFVSSIKVLLNIKNISKPKELYLDNDEINSFCKERNIRIKYFVLN